MNEEFYKKLVDLYAAHELSTELEEQMEFAAFGNAELSHDMITLRRAVDTLRSDRGPQFTEDSYQRVLMKLYARGANIEPKAASPAHMQYQLPMQG